MEYLTDSGSSL